MEQDFVNFVERKLELEFDSAAKLAKKPSCTGIQGALTLCRIHRAVCDTLAGLYDCKEAVEALNKLAK